MTMALTRRGLAIAGGLVLAGGVALAGSTRFSDYDPLTSSAGPTTNEAAPITFGNPVFRQESIADRMTQLSDLKPNSGNWDMITVNETGAHKGRYLFTVFETGQSGVQRHDLKTEATERSGRAWAWRPRRVRRLLLDAVGNADHGGGILGDRSGGSTSPYGRLFSSRTRSRRRASSSRSDRTATMARSSSTRT